MHTIGFSTGAAARGDYQAALALMQREGVRAVELSALRLSELNSLVDDLPRLDLTSFSFVSFHAPSRFELADECSRVRRTCAGNLRITRIRPLSVCRCCAGAGIRLPARRDNIEVVQAKP